jgi:tRNA(fMet)-specific endonuclease VapC
MILDTNALSAFADNDRALLKVLPLDRPWHLPVVVIGEYRVGLKSSREQKKRELWLNELISLVTVLPVTESTTPYYARVRHELTTLNRKIPPNDSWIAALALEHDLPILSRDAHFEIVPKVRRMSW